MAIVQSISSATSSLPPQTPESLPQWVLIAKEILPAIGSLWPVLLILTVAGFLIYYRKEAGNILGRGFKFKGAGAEIEVPPTASVTTIATAVMERVGQTEEGGKDQPKLIEGTLVNLIPESTSEEPDKKQPSTPEEWRYKMFELLRAGQDAEGAAAFERLIEVVSDPVERLDDTALYYFLRYRFLADGSAIDRLQELLAHEEVRSRIYSYLGSCYDVSGLYDKAVE